QFAAHRQWKESERVYPDALKMRALDGSRSSATLMLQMSGAANYYAPDLRLVRYDALRREGWTAIRAWQTRERATIGAVLYGDETAQFFGRDGALFPCRWE